MSNRSWIEGLVMRTHPLTAPTGDKVFVMLTAYMDDSGTHAGAPSSIVAGYWGGVKEWSSFEWKWKKVLSEFGIEEFHAKHFWMRLPPDSKRVEPYTDWDDERHHAFIDKLLQAIESSNITPFAFGVSTKAWEQRAEFWKRTFVGPDFGKGKAHDPLFLSFQVAVAKTVLYCKFGKKMHFVYARDSRNCGRFLQWYQQFSCDTEMGDDRLGDLIFSASSQSAPLQAADLLAYEAQRYKKKSNGDPNAPLRDEYKRALSHLKSLDDFWLFDEPRLRQLEGAVDAIVKDADEKETESRI